MMLLNFHKLSIRICLGLTLVMAFDGFANNVISNTSSERYKAPYINNERAKFNYQMLCQGCHTPKGIGGKDVPKLKGYIGNFLTFKKGREYLVKVPGAANAALNDEHLAELLNWMIVEMSEASLPEKPQFYSPFEISILRATPLMEVLKYRESLVKTISLKNSNNSIKSDINIK